MTDRYRPYLPADLGALPVLESRWFNVPRPEYLALYQMGNNVCHEYMLGPMKANPGVLVLHDVNLHGFFYQITVPRGRAEEYRRLLTAEYGEIGARAAAAVIAGGAPPVYELPLSGPCTNHARLVVVHSQHARRILQKKCPALNVEVIPMGVEPPLQMERRAARVRLGLPQDAFIIGSFGNIIPKKRIHVVLAALARLADTIPIHYVLVGAGDGNYPDVHIQSLGMGGRATVSGYVTPADFGAFLSASDVCINLRYPDDGETSATLIRAMAASRPVVYTPSGSASELPPGVGLSIEPGDNEVNLLANALIRLQADETLKAALGENARKHYLAHHSPELAAQKYVELITRLSQRQMPLHPPYVAGGNNCENRRRLAGPTGVFRRPGDWRLHRPAR